MAEPNNPTNGLTCTYDAWDRLASAGDGTNAITYQYDGTGRLTERIVAGGTTEKYFYSGQQAVQVYSYSSGGTFQGGQQYIWSPLYVDTPILRDTYDSSGDLVAADRLYYTIDANHNVTSVTNSSGVVQERYSYTAYGQVTVYDASWANPGQTSAVGNTRLFAGMDIDPLTGAYYDNARWFNASSGAFFNRDPVESSPNLYAYCGDDPVLLVDPTGDDWWPPSTWPGIRPIFNPPGPPEQPTSPPLPPPPPPPSTPPSGQSIPPSSPTPPPGAPGSSCCDDASKEAEKQLFNNIADQLNDLASKLPPEMGAKYFMLIKILRNAAETGEKCGKAQEILNECQDFFKHPRELLSSHCVPMLL